MTAVVHLHYPSFVARIGTKPGRAIALCLVSLALLMTAIFGSLSAQKLPSPW